MPIQQRRWRDYRTSSGARPVKRFLDNLPDEEVAAIVAAMKEVALEGLIAARHLRGDIYEVRAVADRASYRVLFAVEGRRSQVLLSLEAFAKKSQKTPGYLIGLAERRLRDWRRRGRISRS